MEEPALTTANSFSPCGALPVDSTTTRFEVWAPKAKQVVLELYDPQRPDQICDSLPMAQDAEGHFVVEAPAKPGTLYYYSLDGRPGRPDPRSRFQPLGVHGPSQVVDPNAYAWSDQHWKGIPKRDLVIYEMHVGSLTSEGSYLAAIDQLPRLVDLGITAIELLPLAQTPGRWNWGYDGVNYFAPRNTFGTPDELKRFVDACHGHGIAVINDVVYNHVGPEGNYLSEFGPYRSPKRNTPWGDALNFDAEGSQPVRQFVIDNIAFWIDEYHFDGVRLDAVHYMFDDSPQPILDEIRDQFRIRQNRLDRRIYLIGESNIYDPHLVGQPAQGQPHHDAIWSDCLMHSVYAVGAPSIRLTNRNYQARDLPEALEFGYVFSTPEAVRVTPEIRAANHSDHSRAYIESLIMALQTHDSVGNHPHGKRLHQLTSVDFQLAASALFLLYPSIPMIFMGEEMATDCPFPFFADFEDQRLRDDVDRGRRDEYPHHDWEGSPLPSDRRAFTSSWIDGGRKRVTDWYRDLLELRKLGLEQGWLHVENLKTEADPQHHVYRLAYDHPDGTLMVQVRLDQPEGESIALESDGITSWLLSSCGTDQRELQAQQAVVYIAS